MLKTIEKIVTKLSNPAIHRFHFSELLQTECESIKDFLVRLNSIAKDCEFECPNCSHDLTSTNVKDQLIRGINNSSLQIDVLTFVLKFETLNTLEKILKHVEAFETALSDQSKLSEGKTPDVGSLDTPK